MSIHDTSPPTFELALVMAGAVSAGAYTGGVLDFLLQALDALAEAQEERPAMTPPHKIRIRAISGASAGGISATLLGALVNRDFSPMTEAHYADNNPFYQTWVDGVDISSLLDLEDLKADTSTIQSLLNTKVLERVAERVLDAERPLKNRPYFDTALHVLLSVTNLRGIPYGIQFQGEQQRLYHTLIQHADYLHFLISNKPENTFPDAHLLDPFQMHDPSWDILQQAALATSAFPFGLAPRTLNRPISDYDSHRWWSQLPEEEDLYLAPVWPADFRHDDTSYQFLAVDGGVMNNEPLELVRKILAGDKAHNPRAGDEASRAVLMIDPFPDNTPLNPFYAPSSSLFSVLGYLLNSLKQQARFKPEELVLAASEKVYSRFLISPSRNPPHPALASSPLGGFGGFLARDFRVHDFQLGRRNCQRFLQRYFALPENNPLFADWSPSLRNQYRIEYRNKPPHLPIIPLLGALRQEETLPEWPSYSRSQLCSLEQQLKTRVDALVRHTIQYELTGLTRFAGQMSWWLFARRQLVNKLMTHIETELQRYALLKSSDGKNTDQVKP